MSALKSKIETISKSHGKCTHEDGQECRDYLLEYPLAQRRLVAALENLDSKRLQIESEFRAEVLELEKKFAAKYMPIFSDRASLIKGDREPLSDEVGAIPEDSIQEIDGDDKPISHSNDEKGLPAFWLTALKNHPALAEMVCEGDEPALRALEDVRAGFLANGPGFRLDFFFAENPYFSNLVLSKEYHLASPASPTADDYVYDHAVGSDIDWKEGKNLCFKTVTKTQRQKNGKGTRIVKREEPQDSFFHFFSPPSMPSGDEASEDEEDVEELEQELEADYEMGDIIKSELIPNAIHWFTGKALEFGDYDNYFEDEEDDQEYSDEDSEDEESDDDSIHSDHAPKGRRRGPAAANANQQQCKQQ